MIPFRLRHPFTKPYKSGCAICGVVIKAWTKRGMLKQYRYRLGHHQHQSPAQVETWKRLREAVSDEF